MVSQPNIAIRSTSVRKVSKITLDKTLAFHARAQDWRRLT